MIQKIRKLCKQLQKFTLDEITSIAEINENKMRAILQDLEEENFIKKISNSQYAYIPVIEKDLPELKVVNSVEDAPDEWFTITQVSEMTGLSMENVRRKCKRGEYISKCELRGCLKFFLIHKSSFDNNTLSADIQDVFSDKINRLNFSKMQCKFSDIEEQKVFNQASDSDKKHMTKCLTLFKALNGLVGKELNTKLKELGEKNPEYAMGYSTYLRWKKFYIQKGIRGLQFNYKKFSKSKTEIYPELIEEFENLYLSPKQYSVRVTWEIIRSRHPNEYIPSEKTFMRQLKEKYSQEIINKKRTPLLELPSINLNNSPKPIVNKKIIFDKVVDALIDYMEKLKLKNNETAICQLGYIKNHIYPFWSNFDFKDITQNSIIEYQSLMVAKGYSIASIKRFVSLFCKIIKEYSNIDNLRYMKGTTILPSLECRVLGKYSINKILKFPDKICELWILCLGISPAELSALDYSNINFENKTVLINQCVYRGTAENIRALYKIRTLKIPDVLFNKIPRNKTGKLFESVNVDNYDLLLNTHIKLLLDKNVCINIIRKNLGYQCLNDFEKRYNFLLPQELDDNFQIL